MSDLDIEQIATLVVKKLKDGDFRPCGMTKEELRDMKGILATKRKAAHYGLIFIGIIIIWISKDFYYWIKSHIHLLVK